MKTIINASFETLCELDAVINQLHTLRSAVYQAAINPQKLKETYDNTPKLAKVVTLAEFDTLVNNTFKEYN